MICAQYTHLSMFIYVFCWSVNTHNMVLHKDCASFHWIEVQTYAAQYNHLMIIISDCALHRIIDMVWLEMECLY